MIDFVIIDDNEEPISLIKKIKPKFFAKGFEYGSNKNLKQPPKKLMPLKHLRENIFPPGDHASSKIIQEKSLKISDEKLINLLAINKISKEFC